MSTALSKEDLITLPFTLRDVKEVDDNGGVHYEAVMTGGLLVDLFESGLLTLTNNIRPDHAKDKLPKSNKTRVKIEKWTDELLRDKSVIGNISVRTNPDKVDIDVVYDDEGEHYNLVVDKVKLTDSDTGVFDLAVDSESRMKAIIGACRNPLGDHVRAMRFAVRIWVLPDDEARKVGVLYNTRGDKVNDSTAKFAWAENQSQELARRLVKGSPHLGIDNIEVQANSVSANSHKLTAFNTISKALERTWKGAPQNDADVEAQASWLISAWNSLVQCRREFGILPLAERQAIRKDSVISTAVVIAGLVGAMSAMYANHVDPAIAFKQLAKPTEDEIAGGAIDIFSGLNPVWVEAGVVIVNKVDPKEESERLAAKPGAKAKAPWTSRNSYAARDNATRVLKAAMELADSEPVVG